MGFYFRKSKRLGPFKLNVSRRGLGLSGGTRRGRVSIGSSGQRFSLRLARGLSFRRKL